VQNKPSASNTLLGEILSGFTLLIGKNTTMSPESNTERQIKYTLTAEQ
jgi:hypothetical protein